MPNVLNQQVRYQISKFNLESASFGSGLREELLKRISFSKFGAVKVFQKTLELNGSNDFR
jgi:hypothetical protein